MRRSTERPGRARADFATTVWPLVAAARGDADVRPGAMERLCRLYHPPVVAYLGVIGLGADESEDAAQAFFVEKVLAPGGLFDRADPALGRLRSLVRASLRNFVKDRWRREACRRGLGGAGAPGLDNAPEPAAEEKGASDAFDRAWGVAVAEEAVRRAREHYLASGRGAQWALYERRELCGGVVEPPPVRELAAELGVGVSPHAAIQEVRRAVKQRVDEVLIESAGAAYREEAAYLRGVLGA